MRLVKNPIGLLVLPALAFGLFVSAAATSPTTASAQTCITTYNPETGVYGTTGTCEGSGLTYGAPTANTNPLAFFPYSNSYLYNPYSAYNPYLYNPYSAPQNPYLYGGYSGYGYGYPGYGYGGYGISPYYNYGGFGGCYYC